jgi:hypothetical protein
MNVNMFIWKVMNIEFGKSSMYAKYIKEHA